MKEIMRKSWSRPARSITNTFRMTAVNKVNPIPRSAACDFEMPAKSMERAKIAQNMESPPILNPGTNWLRAVHTSRLRYPKRPASEAKAKIFVALESGRCRRENCHAKTKKTMSEPKFRSRITPPAKNPFT